MNLYEIEMKMGNPIQRLLQYFTNVNRQPMVTFIENHRLPIQTILSLNQKNVIKRPTANNGDGLMR